MKTVIINIILFLLGTSFWALVETIFRVIVSHPPTSLITCCIAGVALIIIYNLSKTRINIILSGFFCCGIITVLELIIGVVCNIYLKMNLWNYGGMFLNLFGQICFKYICIWYIISVLFLYLFKKISFDFYKKI